MAALENRLELRKRSAESLTDPGFVALTTLQDQKGDYLPLEARIKDTSETFSLEIQQSKKKDRLDYSLTLGGHVYRGTVSAEDTGDEVVAKTTLDRVNGHRVITNKSKRGRGEVIGYVNGGFREVPKDKLGDINYWVLTTINHLAKNANHFLPGKGDNKTQYSGGNRYRLLCGAMGAHGSPKPHFRTSFYRTIRLHGADDKVTTTMSVGVSGTFVNFEYRGIPTSEVANLVKTHAKDILPLHFENGLLPSIARAGHPLPQIRAAYKEGRNGDYKKQTR